MSMKQDLMMLLKNWEGQNGGKKNYYIMHMCYFAICMTSYDGLTSELGIC